MTTHKSNTPYVNPDVDYSFLSGFDTITTEQEHQLAELAKPYLDPFQPEQIETHAAFPLKHLEDFATEAEAINFLQRIQYFYLLTQDDFDNPDFSYKDLWMNCHHMHPRKLEGANGTGKDQNDNLVRVPLPVHWYLHYLHQIIAQLTNDSVLLRHGIGGCHGTYVIMNVDESTEPRVEDFFEGHDLTELQTRIKESRTYWNRSRILKSARKYQTKSEWQAKEGSAYNTALKDKQLFNEATRHMTGNKLWNRARILESAKKYQTKNEWYRNEPCAHSAAKRDKQLFDEATKHMEEIIKPTGYWTKERILESSRPYNTKYEWCKAEGSAYKIAKRDKQLFDEATKHMVNGRQLAADRDRIWTKKRILKSARKYQTKKQWETQEGSAYKASLKDKQLFNEATKHMKVVLQEWTKERILESSRPYNTIKEWKASKDGARSYDAALRDKPLFNEATAHMFKMPISNSNKMTDNIVYLYYYLLNNPTLTEHEYLTNDKYYHSLKGKPRNSSKEIKNFFNKYKKEFEAWIQDQITKGIRELDQTDQVNNRYVFTKTYQK